MSKKSKIGIVGAGPSAITLALELKRRGYQDITLFGHPEENQCRTIQVEDVFGDVAACYIHPGYWNTVKKLLKAADMEVQYLVEPELFESLDQREEAPIPFTEKLSLMLGVIRFIFISFWWRLIRFTSLSRNYSMSMEAYLDHHGIGKLANSIFLGVGGNSQGYGFLDEVTAHHTMQWFSPMIFLIRAANARRKGTGILKQGYGGLFHRLLSQFKLEKTNIRSVQPITGSSQKVKLITENGKEYEFDQVAIGCPLDKVESPASYLVNSKTKTDSHVFSFLFTSKKEPFFKDRVYFLDKIKGKKKNAILTMRTYGKTKSGLHVYWCIGYTTKDQDAASLEKMLTCTIEDKMHLPIEKVHFMNIFEYNLRFTGDAIAEGIHLQLQKLQGVGHIWYTGGMLSHWNIDSIHEFNKLLAMKIDFSERPSTFWNLIKHGLIWAYYRLEAI